MAIVSSLAGSHIAHAQHGLHVNSIQPQSPQGYAVSTETIEELIGACPVHVFETGYRWQLVPARLFRYEDRVSYLRSVYPLLHEDQVGTTELPELQAVGVFDRHDAIPDELFSGNHVVELFLAASMRLAEEHPNHALAFFVDRQIWLLLSREARIVFVQPHRIVSDEDAVFYIAAHLQHFGLMRERCRLMVGGRISSLGSLHRQLSIYFEVDDLETALQACAGATAHDLQDQAVALLRAYQWGLRTLNLES